MIRTRDFLLYIIALLFILIGIGFTLVTDLLNDPNTQLKQIPFSAGTAPEVSVLHAGKETDRSQYITALKEKLAAGEGQVTITQSTTISQVEDTAVIEEDTADSVLIAPENSPLNCPEQRDDALVRSAWPDAGVVLSMKEGSRVASYEEARTALVGSTTSTSTYSQDLVSLPGFGSKNSEDTCVPGVIIGVAADGSLIENNQTARFESAWPGSLVGYALDGFPIYAPRFDGVTLDRCGGTDFAGSYGYYLREGEEFIIKCFAGTPTPLN